jgi:hypothetical protein
MNTSYLVNAPCISGNKNPMGSIEIPIDREYPDEELV